MAILYHGAADSFIRSSLTDQTYHRLAADIIHGRRPPGQQLLETVLAKELGVSRTPVREALRLLVNEGLVSSEHDGLAVSRFTVKDIRDLLETEAALDCLACRLAAIRGTETQLAHLEEITVLMEQAAASEDRERWMDADWQLHQQIAEMADNRALARMSGQINSLLARMRQLSTRQSGRLDEASRENRLVVEAIKSRDGDRADRAMKEHVAKVEKVVLGILEDFVVPIAGERF